MIRIERWRISHPRWSELAAFNGGEHRRVLDGLVEEGSERAHLLVALDDGMLVGALGFLVQPIGPEMDVPVIRDREGRALLEAKVRLFHVLEPYRNRGIGTALQLELLGLARSLGCFQVRSRSDLDRHANYSIKLKLGFAIHPAVRTYTDGTSSPGVYWVRRL